MITFEKFNKLRKQTLNLNNKIKKIQRRWKQILCLKNIRLEILKKKWNIELNLLIKKTKGKSTSQMELINKLKIITSKARKKALKNYYRTQRRKYLALVNIN